ncbi:MAG: glutamate-ammonia-ligase adenylyltransferase [gamma proteobacterium endosymbiont of Lamellibrachia anaximandri]|nr:glutamate-ammonia-ligase adenylyltransferase [gamma proteobacterium endosymbiont of Lamellibrachia anaximandri]
MDRGTRNYAIGLGIFVLGLLVLFLYEDPKASDLNDLLEEDAEISAFPYAFRVLRISNGIAVMSSPRSTEVPVARVLGILFPRVAGKSPASAEFQKVQKNLAKVQTKARDLVVADPEIKRVHWELDRAWLSGHGVIVSP